MKDLKDCTENQLRNAIWDLNDGRCPDGGIMADKDNIRRELFRRTGDPLGFHEEPYPNKYGMCQCSICEIAFKCEYANTAKRLPRSASIYGLGLCPKL